MRSRTFIHLLLLAWIILVFGIHYWIYYGPRLARYLQQWVR